MNKYYQAIINTSGDAKALSRVQVLDSAGDIVTIYADKSGTRFTDATGANVNYCEADATGMVEFYWTAASDQTLQVLDSTGELERSIADFANNFSEPGTAANVDAVLGVPAADGNLGTFTGSTIPDSSAVKPALQALETAGEQTALDVADRPTFTELASSNPGEGAALVGYDRGVTDSVPLTLDDVAKMTLRAAEWGVSASASAADNATKLQAAIDYMLANSIDTLVLPAGEIQIDGDIIVGTHSEIGGNYLAGVSIVGAGPGVNGSWLKFSTGSLIVNASSHSLRDFRVTSLTDDGIIIDRATSPSRYPARSEMVNVRAEFCAGSGIVMSDNWLYLMTNIYARQNKSWGIEGRNGVGSGLACNSWTIIGGEIQGNGEHGGDPLGTGGTLKSTGGGIYTGRSVQMNLLGVSIEGNYSDGLVIGEQTRGLLISGCYFEKNGSHQDDRDIRTNRETVPYNPVNAPNSVIIQNSNFTPQAANGTPAAHAIEVEDVIDLRITNPQVYALSGPILYSAEPIRVYESLAGRASGWIDGGWYSSSSYTQSFLKNDCQRYGYPQKHIFSTDAVLPDAAVTPVTPFVVPIPTTAGSRVEINHLIRPGVWGGGGGSGVARIVTTIRRGPAGTTVATRTDDVNFVSSNNAIKTLNNTSTADFRGNYVYAGIERDGTAPEDTLAVSCTVLAVEIITYEGLISARLS